MIRLFRKTSAKNMTPSEIRLSSLERKTNVLLGLVSMLLVIQLISFLTSIGSMFIPTPTTIALVLVVVIAVGYFFLRQIPGLLKRMLNPKTQNSESANDKSDQRSSDLDESIR